MATDDIDQEELETGAHVITLPPLQETLEVLGQPSISLTLKSNTSGGHVFVRLSQVSPEGEIELINSAAAQMLDRSETDCVGQSLRTLMPGAVGLLDSVRNTSNPNARGEFRQMIQGQPREFLAQIAPKAPKLHEPVRPVQLPAMASPKPSSGGAAAAKARPKPRTGRAATKRPAPKKSPRFKVPGSVLRNPKRYRVE